MHNQQLQKPPIKTFLTWDDYDKLVDDLISQLEPNKYHSICGIPRGGMVLGLMMSYKMNLPVISPMELYYNHELGLRHIQDVDKILIVDDIVDSGKTMKPYLLEGYDTAVIYRSHRCPIKAKYEVEISNNWIVFPYECEGMADTVSLVNLENLDQRHGEE